MKIAMANSAGINTDYDLRADGIGICVGGCDQGIAEVYQLHAAH